PEAIVIQTATGRPNFNQFSNPSFKPEKDSMRRPIEKAGLNVIIKIKHDNEQAMMSPLIPLKKNEKT
ncbi:hypothetical protein RSA8_07530, partial [Enterobacter hormaechei subsp. xiangfangensis]